MQTDNPFVNAGIFYVQNVKPGDASAWFLEELNRRHAWLGLGLGLARTLTLTLILTLTLTLTLGSSASPTTPRR